MMCSRIYKEEAVREPRKDVAGSDETNKPLSTTYQCDRKNEWMAGLVWQGK